MTYLSETMQHTFTAPLLPALKIVAIDLFIIILMIAVLSSKTVFIRLLLALSGVGILALVWLVLPLSLTFAGVVFLLPLIVTVLVVTNKM